MHSGARTSRSEGSVASTAKSLREAYWQKVAHSADEYVMPAEKPRRYVEAARAMGFREGQTNRLIDTGTD